MYLPIIVAQCDVQRSLNPLFESSRNVLNKNVHSKIGHLLSFSFLPQGVALKSDITVCNPENPQSKDAVVDVIEAMEWHDFNEAMSIFFRISPQNKVIMQETLSFPAHQIRIRLEWMVYDYDYVAGKYFKHFYTYQKPITCVIKENQKVYIANEIDDSLEEHLLFRCHFRLSLMSEEVDQNIGFAFSATGRNFVQAVNKFDFTGIEAENDLQNDAPIPF